MKFADFFLTLKDFFSRPFRDPLRILQMPFGPQYYLKLLISAELKSSKYLYILKGGGIAQLVSRLSLNLGTWVRIPVGACSPNALMREKEVTSCKKSYCIS